MKVNFWQALGVVLIVVGVILFARSKTGKNDTTETAPDPAPAPPPATAPAQ